MQKCINGNNGRKEENRMRRKAAFGICVMLLANLLVIRTAMVVASPSAVPNAGFEEGVLGEVPANWTQQLVDFEGENPPAQGYWEHELRKSDAAYYEGNYSLYGRASFVHTFDRQNNPTSETWAHSEYIDAENATRVTVHMRGIYRVRPNYWGWNSYIFLGLSDGVNYAEYVLYEYREWLPEHVGQTLEANHYNFTDTGADGQEWYGYVREIPPSLNSSHLRVSIGWRAHTWYWYYPASVEIASYVDQVSLEQTHDVAILNVGCDKTTVVLGQGVKINVTAGNHGSFAETFNVTAYANETAIGQQIVSLNASESQILTFEWNTTDFAIGDYVISVEADVVINETNTADNTYNDGVVKVRWHDVAVVGVVPSVTTIPFGKSVSVDVIVENQGAFAETFNATVFANSVRVQTETVTSLEALASKVLTFEWNTTGFPPGIYTLEATADPVLGENDTADNTFVDGTVTVLLGIHNVAVTGITSDLLIPTASSSTIEVTAENKGGFSETFNVTVYANSSGIQTITVADMMPWTTQTLDFTWNTAGFPLGDYNITATATNLAYEAQTWDNTYVFGRVTIVDQTFLYVYPHTVVVHPGQRFTVDIRICNTIPNLWIWQICLYFDPTILTYISGGISHGADYVMSFGEWYLQSTLCRLTFEAKIEGTSYLNFSRPIPDDTFLLDTGQNVYGCEVLDGTVLVRYGDVSVNNVLLSKTVLCQGYSAPINCTIENKEEFQECFNAVAFAESNPIDGAQVTMNGRCNMSLPLLWNSTGFSKGNYTVSAIAGPLPHETNTSDNYLTGGWIIVSMVGDITGPSGLPDGKVDARDVARICSMFGLKSSDTNYDANWDLTGPTQGVPDGKIDARDVSLISSRYGQKDP
jgi:hypothetical protein